MRPNGSGSISTVRGLSSMSASTGPPTSVPVMPSRESCRLRRATTVSVVASTSDTALPAMDRLGSRLCATDDATVVPPAVLTDRPPGDMTELAVCTERPPSPCSSSSSFSSGCWSTLSFIFKLANMTSSSSSMYWSHSTLVVMNMGGQSLYDVSSRSDVLYRKSRSLRLNVLFVASTPFLNQLIIIRGYYTVTTIDDTQKSKCILNFSTNHL